MKHCIFTLAVLLASAYSARAADRIPERAWFYRKILHAEERRAWGFDLPSDAIRLHVVSVAAYQGGIGPHSS